LWRKSNVSFWEITGRQRLEAAHSETLAWLLDPDESHGLGTRFLSAFLQAVPGPRITLKRLQDARVYREFHMPLTDADCFADVVVQGPGWWLVIENKIGAAEGKDQTKRYARFWRRVASRKVLVYLTPSGEAPKSPDFRPFGYGRIVRIFDAMPPAKAAEPFVRSLLEHLSSDLEDS